MVCLWRLEELKRLHRLYLNCPFPFRTAQELVSVCGLFLLILPTQRSRPATNLSVIWPDLSVWGNKLDQTSYQLLASCLSTWVVYFYFFFGLDASGSGRGEETIFAIVSFFLLFVWNPGMWVTMGWMNMAFCAAAAACIVMSTAFSLASKQVLSQKINQSH